MKRRLTNPLPNSTFDPIRLRLMAQRALADSFKVDLFVKTHSQNIEIGDVPQINAEVTAGVIYIVRNHWILLCPILHIMERQLMLR